MDSLFSKASSFLSSSQADEEGEGKPNSTSSAGYGDMLSKASSFLGSSDADDTPTPPQNEGGGHYAPKHSNSGGSGDMMASAKILLSAAKGGGQNPSPDMGEVAGAAADLIGAANLDKTAYGEYATKAQSYLHEYQASHAKQTDHRQGNPAVEESEQREE